MWYFSWILGLLLACSLGILHILRFEAQETFEREHIPVDRLTGLFTKDVMLIRLREKVENSRNNGFPFSIVALSLEQFCQKHQLLDYEVEAVLRRVTDYLKEELRTGVDIAARMNEQVLLIALPGATLKRAETTAEHFRQDIFNSLQAPRELKIDIVTGVVTYPDIGDSTDSISQAVEQLISTVCQKVHGH
jgi:cyd operon protein YbgT